SKTVYIRNVIYVLVHYCKHMLEADALSVCLFVYRNRRRTAIKILVYDSRGFWLCQKRLSTGRFRFWPESTTEAAKVLEAHELQVLLAGGDPGATQAVPAWRRVA